MVKSVMDILKSIFSVLKLRYIFFFTGSGSNGKSLLFKLLVPVPPYFTNNVPVLVLDTLISLIKFNNT
jgi:hypothetical protein